MKLPAGEFFGSELVHKDVIALQNVGDVGQDEFPAYFHFQTDR